VVGSGIRHNSATNNIIRNQLASYTTCRNGYLRARRHRLRSLFENIPTRLTGVSHAGVDVVSHHRSSQPVLNYSNLSSGAGDWSFVNGVRFLDRSDPFVLSKRI